MALRQRPDRRDATSADSGSGYAQSNYCDLIGTWVNPDTGNWIGLVHNEFTPQPFGDGLHNDAIDYAVSTDQGNTWKIPGHAITSPYSTNRNDTKAFPKQTYYYGDGDQRLFVNTASGYFYVYYGSRVVPKGGAAAAAASPRTSPAHRSAPRSRAAAGRSGTTAPGPSPASAAWRAPWNRSTPGNPTGYTAPAHDYNPATTGTVGPAGVGRRGLPSKSPLFIMNITYDAYLGLYLGTPEVIFRDAAAAVLRHRRPVDAEVVLHRRFRIGL